MWGKQRELRFCFGTGTVQGEPSFTSVPSYHIEPVVQRSALYRTKADARWGKGLHASDTLGIPAYGESRTRHRKAKRKKRGGASQSGMPAVKKWTSAVTPAGDTGFTRCQICKALVKHLERHMKKVHTERGDSIVTAPTPSATPERRKTSATDQLRNPVFQDRLARALDASKEYAHNFRVKGRYGSHPSHDDYGDEGRP